MPPTRRRENKLLKEGYKLIAGLDEAGKGAWAGPIVAAAVILPPKLKIPSLNDSKLLSPNKREKIFILISKQAVNWSVGIISKKTIDQVGIQKANFLAMEKALTRLFIQPDYLLIDYLKLKNINFPSLSLVDGDKKVTSIAAASILAKVTRDYIMIREDRKFPPYGFAQHKGYGTELHFQMIQKHGLSPLHRQSFQPMRRFVSYSG
jgi:ribonuclease HII